MKTLTEICPWGVARKDVDVGHKPAFERLLPKVGKCLRTCSLHLDEERPILYCDLRRVVHSQSAVCRQTVKVDCFRVVDDLPTNRRFRDSERNRMFTTSIFGRATIDLARVSRVAYGHFTVRA